jgi:hypothetical protein
MLGTLLETHFLKEVSEAEVFLSYVEGQFICGHVGRDIVCAWRRLQKFRGSVMPTFGGKVCKERDTPGY